MKTRAVSSLGGTLCLAVALCLISCGGRTATVLHVIGEDYSPMQGLEKIKGGFERETGIRVEISRYDAETLRKKSIGDFQAGAANYDVVMGAFYDLGLFAANGWVLDLSMSLDRPGWKDSAVDLSNFSDAVLNLSCRYRGRLYALPCSGQSMFLWYRKDLFEHEAERRAFFRKFGYELPQPTSNRSMTWTQYRDVAQFFTRRAGVTAAGRKLERDLFGTLIQGKNHAAVWFEFMNFLHSYGGRFIAPDGETVVIDSPEARAALEYYVGLKRFSPPGTVNYTWDDALSTFQNGQVAAVIMWSDAITAVEDPKQSTVAGKVGYAPVPTNGPEGPHVSVFGGWGFFVNARTRHAEEAVRFVQWVNRPDVQIMWAKQGGIPTTLSTFTSPEYRSVPGAAAHLHALKYLVGWSVEPYSARMIEVGQNQLSRAVAGQASPAEALGEMANRVREIIASASKPN